MLLRLKEGSLATWLKHFLTLFCIFLASAGVDTMILLRTTQNVKVIGSPTSVSAVGHVHEWNNEIVIVSTYYPAKPQP